MVTHVPAQLHFPIIGADEDERKRLLVELIAKKEETQNSSRNPNLTDGMAKKDRHNYAGNNGNTSNMCNRSNCGISLKMLISTLMCT
jgi:hypothetical protein